MFVISIQAVLLTHSFRVDVLSIFILSWNIAIVILFSLEFTNGNEKNFALEEQLQDNKSASKSEATNHNNDPVLSSVLTSPRNPQPMTTLPSHESFSREHSLPPPYLSSLAASSDIELVSSSGIQNQRKDEQAEKRVTKGVEDEYSNSFPNLQILPKFVSQFSLIILSFCIGWFFLEMPPWSMWCTLAILIFYDLIAVLATCGPLRYFIEEHAMFKNESMPGLIYHGDMYVIGLGDLIFFGVLVGRAGAEGFFTGLCTLLGLLIGMTVTVILTAVTSYTTLPALPLPLVFGAFLYSASVFLFPNLSRVAISALLNGW